VKSLLYFKIAAGVGSGVEPAYWNTVQVGMFRKVCQKIKILINKFFQHFTDGIQ
jgi:hypothetical protein